MRWDPDLIPHFSDAQFDRLRKILRRAQSNCEFAMISAERAAKLLIPFGVELNPHQLGQLMAYLELLLRWNARINLTAVRSADEIVTRHFGESLSLATRIALAGASLDIGSGAGFPGLALKIVFPSLKTTLLEPVAKKRAFLKEVVRVCEMSGVDVRAERIEDFVGRAGPLSGLPGSECRFDSVTARAVGGIVQLAGLARECLKPGGRLCFWVGREQFADLSELVKSVSWEEPIELPLSRQRVIAVGVR